MHALPRWIWSIIIGVLFIVLLLTLLYFFQHRLIFHPTSLSEGDTAEIRSQHPEAEEITIPVTGEVTVHGWLIEGDPDEEALLGDALQIYDEMAVRDDIDSDNIVTMGRSIGSAVATHLGAEREVQGTILVSPFDEFLNVAQA